MDCVRETVPSSARLVESVTELRRLPSASYVLFVISSVPAASLRVIDWIPKGEPSGPVRKVV